jgi:hypothetical protein
MTDKTSDQLAPNPEGMGMETTSVTVHGVLKPDGTLELSQPVGLPPGPVEVTVQTAAPVREDTWTVLQRIWAEQKAEGRQPRTVEEIDAGINELRDELEEHALAIERLQEEAEAQRKNG